MLNSDNRGKLLFKLSIGDYSYEDILKWNTDILSIGNLTTTITYISIILTLFYTYSILYGVLIAIPIDALMIKYNIDPTGELFKVTNTYILIITFFLYFYEHRIIKKDSLIIDIFSKAISDIVRLDNANSSDKTKICIITINLVFLYIFSVILNKLPYFILFDVCGLSIIEYSKFNAYNFSSIIIAVLILGIERICFSLYKQHLLFPKGGI